MENPCLKCSFTLSFSNRDKFPCFNGDGRCGDYFKFESSKEKKEKLNNKKFDTSPIEQIIDQGFEHKDITVDNKIKDSFINNYHLATNFNNEIRIIEMFKRNLLEHYIYSPNNSQKIKIKIIQSLSDKLMELLKEFSD